MRKFLFRAAAFAYAMTQPTDAGRLWLICLLVTIGLIRRRRRNQIIITEQS